MSAMASSARRYRMKCLGPVVLESPAGARLGLRTRKQLGLLFHLARRARPVARDELIELFWGEDEGRLARHSLSQCTSLINKALGAEVIVPAGRDRLALAESAVATDVAEFERLVAEGRHEDALALWRGPLFEGIWVQRAPEFERWLAEERARVQRVFRRLVHARIGALRDQGDHQEIRDEAERLLELDPLDETAMLAYLESLTILGDRSLALRRFAEFESRLRKELEAEPGSALKAWAKRQRKGDAPPARDATPIPRISEITVLPAAQPFYGRTEEFSMLWKAWERAGSGRGSFIIIEGEAGIGKTALATKLANQAHVAGGSICFVRCYRAEKSVPFAPIATLVRQLSRLPGFVALDPVWIGELSRLVPELRDRFPSSPQPMALDGAARHRLSDATMSAAAAVADESPLMIAIDDIHDADEASLTLLHYLRRQVAGQCIQLIATTRPGLQVSELERAFYAELRSGSVLTLGALGSQDVQKLAGQVAARRGLQLSDSMINVVIRYAAGNPLRAIEAASRPPEQTLSSNLSDDFGLRVLNRFGELSETAQALARAIAVAGRPLSDYELVEVTGAKIAEISAAVGVLETEQLLRRVGPNLGFAHERYGAVIETEISQDSRASIHLALAELLRRSADRNPAARFDVARHFAAAGKKREAKKQALRAVHYARSLGAVRERANALILAMSMSDTVTADLAAKLGACYLELGEFEKLAQICYREASYSELTARDKANFGYLRIANDYHGGGVPLPLLVKQLGVLLDGRAHFDLEAASRTLQMRLAYKSLDETQARAAAKSLRRMLRGLDVTARAHELQATAYVAAKFFSPKRALPILRQALSAACSAHDLDLEHLIRSGIGAVSRQLARFEESLGELRLARALAQRTLNPQLEASSLVDIAVAEMSMGRLADAEKSFSQASAIFAKHSDRVALDLLPANLGELYLQMGRLEEASELFLVSLEQARRSEDAVRFLQAVGGLGLCAQRSGNHKALRSWARETEELKLRRDLRSYHERWMVEAALAWDRCINRNDPEGALHQLQEAFMELQRRDLDHALMTKIEYFRIAVSIGQDEKESISKLRDRAAAVGADLVRDQANQLLG